MGLSTRRAWLAARRRWRAGAALAACLLAVCWLAARPPAPAPAHGPAPGPALAQFPRTAPAHLARLLADISAHTLQGPWSLEEEAGNYTSWRYSVSYECGDRCEGRAHVEAHEMVEEGQGAGAGAGAPRHGAADRHRVVVRRIQCTALPLLPWPKLCEEIETESLVSKQGSGAQLEERWVSRCGLAGCAGHQRLQQLQQQRMQRLQRLAGLLPDLTT